MYVRRLPHWRQEGVTYFVTFRLADSLPQAKLDELRLIRSEWVRRHPRPWSKADLESLGRNLMTKIETALDQNTGSCVLANRPFAELVMQSLLHFDNQRYELNAAVVMPNHVHAIVRPLFSAIHPLESILGSWKQYSSKRINAQTGGENELWQDESYDRIIRDEKHLYQCLQYIGQNPRKARLTRANCPLWIRPEWAALGWTFEDDAR
jgi:REP element-mobilizing transposase RayT